VRYLHQAGAKAFAHSANREAVAYFEQALAALVHLPETRETLEQAIDVRFGLRNSLVALGELQRVTGYLREAEALARKLEDQRRHGWLSLYMSHYFAVTGYPTEARTFGQSAHTIAETLGDFPLQIGANVYVGAAYLASGDHRRAEDFLQAAVLSLEGDRIRERFGLHGFPAVLSRWYLVWSLAERGALAEGSAQAQEGVRIAEAIDHPYSVVVAYCSLARLYGVKGDFGQAVRLLERGLALASEWNLTLLSPIVGESLGHVYALSGRVAEGLPLLQQAVKAMESIGMTHYHLLGLMHLGEACVLADRLEDAMALAGRVLTVTRERGQRGYEAWALRLLGAIASHREFPDVETAEGHYRQSLALADELSMRPLLAHCHLGLGTLYGKVGRLEQARAELAAAIELYRSMDMTFWLAQAEPALAQAP